MLMFRVRCAYTPPRFLPLQLKQSVCFLLLPTARPAPGTAASRKLAIHAMKTSLPSSSASVLFDCRFVVLYQITADFSKITPQYDHLKGACLCAIAYPSDGKFWMQVSYDFLGILIIQALNQQHVSMHTSCQDVNNITDGLLSWKMTETVLSKLNLYQTFLKRCKGFTKAWKRQTR